MLYAYGVVKPLSIPSGAAQASFWLSFLASTLPFIQWVTYLSVKGARVVIPGQVDVLATLHAGFAFCLLANVCSLVAFFSCVRRCCCNPLVDGDGADENFERLAADIERRAAGRPEAKDIDVEKGEREGTLTAIEPTAESQVADRARAEENLSIPTLEINNSHSSAKEEDTVSASASETKPEVSSSSSDDEQDG